jgi:hypothetical protein
VVANPSGHPHLSERRGLNNEPHLMTTTETFQYRGYEIVPRRQWSQWCASVYPTRSDLPLLLRSTLRTMADRKEEALAKAKQRIDLELATNS